MNVNIKTIKVIKIIKTILFICNIFSRLVNITHEFVSKNSSQRNCDSFKNKQNNIDKKQFKYLIKTFFTDNYCADANITEKLINSET